MEFRARYLLMGVFILAAILLALGFVYWLRTTVGLGDRAAYVVRFDTPAIGLWKGAPVLFNGVRVGDVSGLRLNPAEPEQLLVDVTVSASAPVRADTVVGLSFQGLAGVPAISDGRRHRGRRSAERAARRRHRGDRGCDDRRARHHPEGRSHPC